MSMTLTFNQELIDAYIDRALEELVSQIRVSESQQSKGKTHFDAITSLLNNSELAQYNPKLRLQGSMRLGTATSNSFDEEKFDIDIVVELQNVPSYYTPKDVKEAVGRVLKSSDRYAELLDPKEGGKRCWTIKYADGTHVDLLPSVVNEQYGRIVESSSYSSLDEFGIRITDKTRVWEYLYETDRTHWLLSNPIGFAEWFLAQATINDTKHKSMSASQVRASIEPMPHWKKDLLTLQKIVCLLKRHRDIMFGDDKEKPISMILTVLAAKAFCQAPIGGLYKTLKYVATNLVRMMDSIQGRKSVLNPVNREEDFTDRWRASDGGMREAKFYQWVEKLNADLREISKKDKVGIGTLIKMIFGEKAGKRTIEAIARKEMEENTTKKMTASGIFSATTGVIAAKPNTFFGN